MKKLLLILALAIPAYGQMLQSIVNNKATAATPSFTINTPAHQFTCSATTCTVTMTCTSGHTYVIEAHTNNPVVPASASACGTIVPVYSTSSGVTNSLFSSTAYIVSASSGSNPVITFSGAVGNSPGPSTVNIRDVTAVNGTPFLDFAKSETKAGTTSVTGETPVLSGAVDYAAQSNNTDYQITTACTVYGHGVFDASNGPGWCDLTGASITTPPVWTIASGTGNANPSAIVLGITGTPCVDEGFITFSGSGTSNGTTVTAALLNASTFGYPVTGLNNGWGLPSGGTGMTFNNTSLGALNTNVRNCDGTTRGSASSLVFKYDFSTPVNKTANFQWIGSATKASVIGLFQTSLTSSSTNEDFMSIQGTAVNSAVGLQYGSGNVILECFGGTVTTANVAAVTTSVTYKVELEMDTAVGGAAHVYDSSGTLLGSNTCAAGGWTATPPNTLLLGRFGGATDTPAAAVFLSNIRVNAAGGSLIP